MRIHCIKTPDSRELYPPLGFSYLMAYMISFGYEIEYIDSNLIDYPFSLFEISPRKCVEVNPDWDKIRESIRLKNIECALLTGSFTRHISNTAKLAGILKEINPGCVVITGGVHVSALPEDTLLRFKDIDYIVLGEGEKTIIKLLSALASKTDLGKVPCLAYRNNDRVVLNRGELAISDLDKLPNPCKTVWPVDQYRKIWKYLWNGRDPLGMVMTSRGCIGRCEFCASGKKDIPMNRLRSRSFENIKNELDELVEKYGIWSIDFIDDCFIVNADRLELICGYLKDKKIPWWCKSRVDTVNYDTLRMMKNSGCNSIFLGIESTNDRILASMGKGVTLDKIGKSLSLFEDVGLEYTASFTIGHPGETRESMLSTLDFAKKLARKGIGVGLYLITPYPGTRLYDISVEKRWLYSRDWDNFDQLAIKDSVYAYGDWSPNELSKFYRSAWKELNQSRFWGKIFNLSFVFNKIRRVRSVGDIKILLNHLISLIKIQIFKP